MAVLSLIAGLVVLTIIVIAWINESNTASNTAKQAAATDPLDPRYWTPERIALSHARADAVQHGKVLIGMYAVDCRSAWGTPEKVDKTTTANGVSEWWWYRDGRGFASFYDGSDPNGIRTRVTAVKGRCPGPLDDRVTKPANIGIAILSRKANRQINLPLYSCSERSLLIKAAARAVAPWCSVTTARAFSTSRSRDSLSPRSFSMASSRESAS